MPKYQLTERQNNILRAVSKGLRKRTVKTKWSWLVVPLDTDDFDVELIVTGFPDAETLGLELSDLHYFARLGFLQVTDKDGSKGTCDVFEQVIHDAVDNDFQIPDNAATSTNVQAHFHGDVTRSNINTAQHMSKVCQTVQSSKCLSPDVQADIRDKVAELQQELKKFEETHSREIREVTRSLDIVIGDLADSESDEQNVTGSLSRLKRAGNKLIFAPLAKELVGEIADKISSIIPS